MGCWVLVVTAGMVGCRLLGFGSAAVMVACGG